jgi:nucleotide-binding universal stress UspA family protein
MFERILFPVDLTLKGDSAMNVVGELAVKGAAVVTLLHVIPTIEGVDYEEIRDFYETLREKARQTLAEYAARFTGRQVEVETEIVFGKPAQQIVHYAAQRDVDLIVLGSHRVDPEQPGTGWGSLSYRVAILAQCPVLLVK